MQRITVSGPIGDVEIAGNLPFTLISGPCQIESHDHALRCAESIAKHAENAGVALIFKASFDKANRTSGDAVRGVGLAEGLRILDDIRTAIGVPVLTDVHNSSQCDAVAEVVDILQIPAFLCRQTDLLVSAARTGKPINIKKGQFLAPWDMANVAAKVSDAGNDQILLTERGTSFGYNTLVSDFRSLPIMSDTGYPVIFDATHSAQQPGGQGGSSGGQREFVPVLARAALAVGVAGLFVEAHNDPDNAPSDGPNMLNIAALPELFKEWRDLDALTKSM